MMEFTKNDSDKCEIINKILILTKGGTDTIHAVIIPKYQKYPSTTILKHANFLVKVNKLPWGCLHNIPPHDSYSIKIHLCTVNLSDISK